MIRDCNLIVLIALVIVGVLMPVKRIEPSASPGVVIPSGSAGSPPAAVAGAGLFLPDGRAFPQTEDDWRKVSMLANYLVAARDLLGLPETKALEIAAEVLWVFPGQPPRRWQHSDGVEAIWRAIP